MSRTGVVGRGRFLGEGEFLVWRVSREGVFRSGVFSETIRRIFSSKRFSVFCGTLSVQFINHPPAAHYLLVTVPTVPHISPKLKITLASAAVAKKAIFPTRRHA